MNRIKLRFKSVALMLLLLSSVCPYSSCGGDDSDSGGNSNTGYNSEIISTLMKYKWMSDADYDFNEYDTWMELTKDVVVYYFVSETEGVMRHHHKWIDSSGIDDEGRTVDNIYFTYTVRGNEVTVQLEDIGRQVFTCDGSSLTGNGGSLRAVTPSSGDWAQVKALFPQSGKTGDCTYTYYPRTHHIEISGNGAMADYSSGNQPWKDYQYTLTSVSFDEGVTYIGNNAFRNFMALQDVFFPLEMKLKTIGKEAFAKTALTNVKFPPSLEVIKVCAFVDCSKLSEIAFTYGTQIKTIEERAFGGCSIKKSLFVDDTVETIGMMAFGGSYNYVEIGNHVKSLGAYPFATTATTGSLYVNRGTPPSVTQGLTPNDSKWTLYVPVGCKSAYQNAAVWKSFKSIVESSSLEKGDDYTGGGSSSGGSGYKTCPDSNHPHMIDLGLPSGTKWACCNVGASKPEDYGGYYAWGETKEKNIYNWTTYKWCNGNEVTQTKYNSYTDFGIVDNKSKLDPADDVACFTWGVSWYSPSKEQCEELITKCSSVWEISNGIAGRMFTGNNGNSIFLPAAGYKSEDEYWVGIGAYWTSEVDEYTFVHYFCIEPEKVSINPYFLMGIRYQGYSVRPVR